jgi:ubiquinone/menaquinone biosynthesis C-methylase UbiE
MNANWLPVIYERLWRPIGFRILGAGHSLQDEEQVMGELLDLRSGEVVLDIACGPGNSTRRLVADVGDDGLVMGLDAAAPMLARAVTDTNAPNVAYVRGDAEHLPFGDATFDAVSCFAALYLVDDPDAVLAEMARVLRPGGRLAILTSVHRGPAPLRFAFGLSSLASGVRIFGRDEVVGALEADGLKVTRQEVHGFAQFVGARRPGRRRKS